jgi:hypothetical protein
VVAAEAAAAQAKRDAETAQVCVAGVASLSRGVALVVVVVCLLGCVCHVVLQLYHGGSLSAL